MGGTQGEGGGGGPRDLRGEKEKGEKPFLLLSKEKKTGGKNIKEKRGGGEKGKKGKSVYPIPNKKKRGKGAGKMRT